MSRLSANLISNFLNRGWGALLAFLLIPQYVRFVGIEGYGIFGLYAILLSLLSVLDLGFSTSVNREMATGFQAFQAHAQALLVRTLEWVYYITGMIIGALVAVSANFIASHWLNPKELPIHTIEQSIILMGIAIAAYWPTQLYASALAGLEKQVTINLISSSMTALRSIGAIAILYFFPQIQAFFFWQIFINLVQTFWMAIILWNCLPQKKWTEFDRRSLNQIWCFAKGVTGISITSIILTNLDKIVLSKTLNLENYGYYTLSFNIANILTYFTAPIFGAYFPRFSQLFSQNKINELKLSYHQACQIVAVFVLPVSLFIILFSKDLIYLWTQNNKVAESAHLITSLLMMGSMLNGLMTIPFALQLSHGWTRLNFIQNVISIAFLAPFLIWSTHLWAAYGAALSWFLLNLGYILITIPIMHKKVFKQESRKWYVQDVLLPLFFSSLLLYSFRLLPVTHLKQMHRLFVLGAILCVTIFLTAWILPQIRQLIFSKFKGLKKAELS